MKRSLYAMKNIALLGVLAIFTFSCSNDSEDSPPDQELSQTELQTILETDDISSVADNALAEAFIGGDPAGKNGNDCYEAEYTDTGFTIVFNNCNLNGTDNVNGTLTVVYETSEQSSAFTATYDSFFVGDIELNGTRSYTFDANMDQTSYSFNVTSNMTATMGDGTLITETGTKTFGFTFGEDLESTAFTISGNWTVTIGENSYSIEVTSTLEASLNCAYITQGTMDVNKNGLEVTVDFGDGSCDDVATVIYPNGATQDITLND